MLSNAIEGVNSAFFYSDSTQHLQYEEEILFGHFMTTVNDAIEWQLTLEDMEYKSESESLNVPTSLWWEPQPFHVSTQDNLSFRPATPKACSSPGYLNAVHCCLTYEEDDESSPDPRMEDHSPEDNILAYHLPRHCRRKGQWHRRTLSDCIIGWWCLDVRTCSREALAHPQKLTTWSVPLPVPVQFESITPHSRRCPTVHRPQ